MPAGVYERKPKDYGTKVCVVCGNEFGKKPKEKPYKFKQRKCCSRQCNARLSATYCIGKKAHNNQQVKRICRYCGKSKMVAPAFGDRPYCNRKCMAEDYKDRLRAENHWNWQGGITEKQSRDNLYEGYKDWRKAVFKRDNYTCRECGNHQSGVLVAHHIKERKDYPELLLDVDNGLTLCKDCHKKVHYGKV